MTPAEHDAIIERRRQERLEQGKPIHADATLLAAAEAVLRAAPEQSAA